MPDVSKIEASIEKLFLAAEQGDEKTLSRALSGGADLNATNSDYWTALHVACAEGHFRFVRSLIAAGADPNLALFNPFFANSSMNGKTPMHVAAEHGQCHVISILASCGSDINARSRVLEAPIHLAARAGHRRAVEKLVQLGAAINARDWLGRTPLHFAVEADHVEVVRALKKGGCHLRPKDNSGTTPLQLAREMKDRRLVDALAGRGLSQLNCHTGPSSCDSPSVSFTRNVMVKRGSPPHAVR